MFYKFLNFYKHYGPTTVLIIIHSLNYKTYLRLAPVAPPPPPALIDTAETSRNQHSIKVF